MTLSARNRIFKMGLIFALLCLVLCIIATIQAIPVYDSMETGRRPGGIFQMFFGQLLDVRLLAVNGSIIASVVFSALSVIFVYYFFEKTLSPEILFVVLFALSFSVETLRLIIPLWHVYEIPSLYILVASRIILFARDLGIFSLFAASVFAVGYGAQRQRNAILFITIAALIIALGVPIDTQTWDSSLRMITGYIPMFRLIEAGIFFITVISFFVAVWARGSRVFIFIGSGSVLALLGRNILLHADTWAGLSAGMVFLVAGIWLICKCLHKIYLWL